MNYVVSGRLGDFLHVLYVVWFHSATGGHGSPATLYVSSSRRYGGEPFGRPLEETLGDLQAFVERWCPYIARLVPLGDHDAPPDDAVNLNLWRTIHGRSDWISSLHRYYGFTPLVPSLTPAWCVARDEGRPPRPHTEPYVVVHRSHVRHNPAFPWGTWLDACRRRRWSVWFLTASPDEYAAFPWKHTVSFKHAPTLCEMAQWMHHAEWVIANQSSPLALAVSLGKRCLVELNPDRLDAVCYMHSPLSNGEVYWFYNAHQHRLPGDLEI